MNLDLNSLSIIYAVAGREAVRRMLTLPSGPLVKQAQRNRDEPQEILDKRDAATDAIIALIEEYANLDND
jgi:hypothetical protein